MGAGDFVHRGLECVRVKTLGADPRTKREKDYGVRRECRVPCEPTHAREAQHSFSEMCVDMILAAGFPLHDMDGRLDIERVAHEIVLETVHLEDGPASAKITMQRKTNSNDFGVFGIN